MLWGFRSSLTEVDLRSQSSLPSMPLRAEAPIRGGMLNWADPLESVESRRRRLWSGGAPLAPPPPPAPSMLPGMLGAGVPATPQGPATPNRRDAPVVYWEYPIL